MASLLFLSVITEQTNKTAKLILLQQEKSDVSFDLGYQETEQR